MTRRPAPPLRPQRLLHEVVKERERLTVPSGIGLDSPGVRLRMVERLRRSGVAGERVLAAFAAIPRHRFVDSAFAPQAYEDTSLPIGHGQTISKPSVVARMLELLVQAPGAAQRANLGRVLEIGTGCGYQAALLALMSGRLISVERIEPLHGAAKVRLNELSRELPLCPWELRFADGAAPLSGGPFDAILSAAGGSAIPQAWLDQLAPGGRLVAPVSDDSGRSQRLMVVDRKASNETGAEWRTADYEAVSFVPLKSGVQN
ncbi:protein-L-isoaspartate O-methyltransferase family protein [Inhella gelatinilytica]|uniref:Protein-L-isoaspartate O-methyltransferase n=1 Tax=Inhella gelatinilytica TaxID=2795030 RepID=A0A931NE64_9BURK|nr:protein-L-isoaspartate O-methyltransferase [Inhella gelatinilytica]MBH9553354.1 protein-L-isoaspartate O-methyltransferase [Inhella gelatinilytica]